MNNEVSEGDTIKVIGNHSWRGHEGIVEQVEDLEGEVFVHTHMDNDQHIILRPGQYKVTKRDTELPGDTGERLSAEVLPHIHRVTNNHKISKAVRAQFLANLCAELRALLEQLQKEVKQS